MRQLLIGLAGLLIAGCVAMGGAGFVQDAYVADDRSIIYVYRPSAFVGIGECYPVFVDNTKLDCLKVSGYIRYEIQPGMHMVSLRNPIDDNQFLGAFDINMVGGKVYYFQGSSMAPFKLIDERVALADISATSEQFNGVADGL